MASIVVSDYTAIVNKLEILRTTVSGAWSTVTTYGSGVKPSTATGTNLTAKQINTLVEAYFDFKAKWIGSTTCSATYGNCSTYGDSCNITTSCAATLGNCVAHGDNCLSTGGTCSATYGNCTTYGTECSSTGGTCSATYGNCTAYGTECSVTDSCAATSGNCATYGVECLATDSCAATYGNCPAYGSECSITLECSSNCTHTNCSSTCDTHTCGTNVSYKTVCSAHYANYNPGGSGYKPFCSVVYDGYGG